MVGGEGRQHDGVQGGGGGRQHDDVQVSMWEGVQEHVHVCRGKGKAQVSEEK